MVMGDFDLIQRVLGRILTLYMLLVIVRCVGAWIELDLDYGRLKWVKRITDPPIVLARQAIGQVMGPFDWAPIAVLFVCWIVRIIVAGF